MKELFKKIYKYIKIYI